MYDHIDSLSSRVKELIRGSADGHVSIPSPLNRWGNEARRIEITALKFCREATGCQNRGRLVLSPAFLDSTPFFCFSNMAGKGSERCSVARRTPQASVPANKAEPAWPLMMWLQKSLSVMPALISQSQQWQAYSYVGGVAECQRICSQALIPSQWTKY